MTDKTFDSGFQDELLANLIKHPMEFVQNAAILKSAYFTGVERIATARAMFAYFEKCGRFPSEATIGQIVYNSILRTTEEKSEDEIMAYVKKLLEREPSQVNVVVDEVVSFARERAVYVAIQNSLTYHIDGKIPPGGYCKLFEDALKVGLNTADLGYVIAKEGGDTEAIMSRVTQHEYGTPTGYADLDQLWPFGWGPGWLIAILAPPKRFKTTFALNLAMNIVENPNSPVLYYPCEITQELAAIRCLCNLTGLSNDDLYQNKDAFLERALAAQREKMESPLLIKGYPSMTATIAGDIRAHAQTARQKLRVNPKAIIIDFAETVKPSSDMKLTSEHRAQGEIYLEARALGAEFNCPVILPDRCNRETVGRSVPSMKSFQGSFEKAGIVDVAIGLCADDYEYANNIIRYFVFLNRHGMANQHFRGTVDPKSMTMTILEKIQWKPQQDEWEGGRRDRQYRY